MVVSVVVVVGGVILGFVLPVVSPVVRSTASLIVLDFARFLEVARGDIDSARAYGSIRATTTSAALGLLCVQASVVLWAAVGMVAVSVGGIHVWVSVLSGSMRIPVFTRCMRVSSIQRLEGAVGIS